MKVIMLADVYKHGTTGEIVEVADGFARNYLIPRGLAVKATKSELRRTEKIRERAAIHRAAYENKLNELARLIDGVELIFGRRASTTGKLFGSVTTQEIADALNEKTGIDINRRRISQQPLREVGTHMVPVRLGSEISPTLKVIIVNQDELAQFLAAREKAELEAVPDAEAIADEGAVTEAKPENLPTEVIPQGAVAAVISAKEAEETSEEPNPPTE